MIAKSLILVRSKLFQYGMHCLMAKMQDLNCNCLKKGTLSNMGTFFLLHITVLSHTTCNICIYRGFQCLLHAQRFSQVWQATHNCFYSRPNIWLSLFWCKFSGKHGKWLKWYKNWQKFSIIIGKYFQQKIVWMKHPFCLLSITECLVVWPVDYYTTKKT